MLTSNNFRLNSPDWFFFTRFRGVLLPVRTTGLGLRWSFCPALLDCCGLRRLAVLSIGIRICGVKPRGVDFQENRLTRVEAIKWLSLANLTKET